MDRLKDCVIIVTGGGNGIGRAYSQGLAGEGAKVVVADIDGPAAETVAQDLGESWADALAVLTDVSQQDSTENMAAAAIDRFGRIDGLINNAAMFQRPNMYRGPFEEMPVEEWDRLMAINLRGIFLCCRAVVPQMKQQGSGKIVNISSGAVFVGSRNLLHYVTSKAGVIGLTRGMSRELGDYNITVNAIAPGLTISKEDMPDVQSGRNAQRVQARAIKRDEVPEDLVGTAIFLCSSDSNFMTGQTLVVDGGAQMH